MKTTHVRPDELIGYEAGEAHDEEAYAECLRRSVHEVVAKQRDAGTSRT